MRGAGNLHGLPDLKPGKVVFVSVENQPHRGKVGDFEQAFALLDVLAFVGGASDDGATQRSKDLRGPKDCQFL